MQDQFQELVKEAILSLPQDLKAVLRIIEDPDLEDEHRIQCAGAILHVLSGVNSIPGARGVLAYVDDALVLRIVLEQVAKTNAELIDRYREDAPELLGNLEDFVGAARSYLGELMEVLEKSAGQAGKLTHQGHSAVQCATDTEAGTWLYDAVQSAIVEQLEFDEDEVARETKRVDLLLQPLRSRAMRG